MPSVVYRPKSPINDVFDIGDEVVASIAKIKVEVVRGLGERVQYYLAGPMVTVRDYFVERDEAIQPTSMLRRVDFAYGDDAPGVPTRFVTADPDGFDW